MIEKVMRVLALVGLFLLFGAVGSIETATDLVIPVVRICIAFGLMMPLFIKYFWKEYLS